jgi:hypothetical protein
MSGTCNDIPVDHIRIEGDLLVGHTLTQDGDTLILRQAYCRQACGPKALAGPEFVAKFFCNEDEELCYVNRPIRIGNFTPSDDCFDTSCDDPESQVTYTYPLTADTFANDHCYGGAGAGCTTAPFPTCCASGGPRIFGVRVVVSPSNVAQLEHCCNVGNFSISGHVVATGGSPVNSLVFCGDTVYRKVADCTYEFWRCGYECFGSAGCGGADVYLVVSVGSGEVDPEDALGVPCSKTQSFLINSTTYVPADPCPC